jgi:hypothetical protein
MSRARLYVLNKYVHRFECYNGTKYSQNSREHLVNTKCSFVAHFSLMSRGSRAARVLCRTASAKAFGSGAKQAVVWNMLKVLRTPDLCCCFTWRFSGLGAGPCNRRVLPLVLVGGPLLQGSGSLGTIAVCASARLFICSSARMLVCA